MGVQHLRQPIGDAGDADVPGDVPRQLALGDAEIAERARQDPPVVIRGEQEGRLTAGVDFMDRINLALAEQLR